MRIGIPRRQRRARMEAGVPYLRAAFRGEPLPDGPHGSSLPVTPVPAQGAALPIYMAGEAEPALERVARLADGFLAAVSLDPLQELPALWRILRPYLENTGATWILYRGVRHGSQEQVVHVQNVVLP